MKYRIAAVLTSAVVAVTGLAMAGASGATAATCPAVTSTATPQIDQSKTVPLKTASGQRLRADAACAWDAAVGAYGKGVPLTNSWRSYATQVQFFTTRYRPVGTPNVAWNPNYPNPKKWNGINYRLLKGQSPAAVPGTSNHGAGVAVDVQNWTTFNNPARLAFLKVAASYGWYDTEGRGAGEPWHITYYPARDKNAGIKPTPPPPSGLAVNGVLDSATISAWQRAMGTSVDGKIGNPSALIKAWQNFLRSKGITGKDGRLLTADGIQGPNTIWATQAYLGTPRDGVISVPSQMVRVLQTRLNAGTLLK
jgi:hypothetical protein